MSFLGAALTISTRPWPALIATLITGACSAIWRQAVAAEVFALHILLLSILLWLAILWEHSEDPRRREILLATSFILGCCLAHQHIIALAAPPFLLFGIWAKGRGRAWGFSWMTVPIFLIAWLAPYALQMYVAQQSPALNWETPTTLHRLVNHFLRKTYGTGLLNVAALKFDERAGDAQVTAYMVNLVRGYFPFPAFLILGLSLDCLLVSPSRPRLWLFAGVTLVYGPFFAILGNQPAEEFYGDMMERFYSSSMVGLGGLIAFGLEWGFYVLKPAWSKYLPGLLGIPLFCGIANYPRCSQRGNYLAVDTMRASFRQLPPRSAFLVWGDLPAGAADYLRYGLGEFRNVLVILPGLTSGQFFRDRLPIRVARAATAGKAEGDSISSEEATQKIVDYLEAQGYDIYCNEIPSGLQGEFTRVGLLLRYRKKGPAWSPERLQSECERAFDILKNGSFRGPTKLDWRQGFWIRYCLNQWVTAYRELAKALAKSDAESACEAMNRVISIEATPQLNSYLNRAGLNLGRERYPEAIRDYEICLRIAPTSKIALEGLITAYRATKQPEIADRYEKRLRKLPP